MACFNCCPNNTPSRLAGRAQTGDHLPILVPTLAPLFPSSWMHDLMLLPWVNEVKGCAGGNERKLRGDCVGGGVALKQS